MTPVTEFNLSIFELLHGLAGRSPFLDFTVVSIAQYAAYLALIIFVVGIVRMRADWRMRVAIFAHAALAVILARGIVTEGIRFFFPSVRPFLTLGFEPLLTETSNAFPSGHAAVFFALATTLFFYDRKKGWWFLAFALINGIARVIAGVHWPVDIVGGVLVGVLGGVVIRILLKPHLDKLQGIVVKS